MIARKRALSKKVQFFYQSFSPFGVTRPFEE